MYQDGFFYEFSFVCDAAGCPGGPTRIDGRLSLARDDQPGVRPLPAGWTEHAGRHYCDLHEVVVREPEIVPRARVDA